ncbi:MAG TPA: hypothetical protein VNO55_08565 [Polyangia bacterium]|nr:hypothetical protein [Polyangia bacterium]
MAPDSVQAGATLPVAAVEKTSTRPPCRLTNSSPLLGLEAMPLGNPNPVQAPVITRTGVARPVWVASNTETACP